MAPSVTKGTLYFNASRCKYPEMKAEILIYCLIYFSFDFYACVCVCTKNSNHTNIKNVYSDVNMFIHFKNDCTPQILKADIELKRQTMDKLCSLVQDLLSSIRNKQASEKLEAKLEKFAQRWDKLVQKLQLVTSKVMFIYVVFLFYSICYVHLIPMY